MVDKEESPENAKEAPQDDKLNDEPEVVKFPPEEEAVSVNQRYSQPWTVISRFYFYHLLLHLPSSHVNTDYISRASSFLCPVQSYSPSSISQPRYINRHSLI